MTKTSVFGVGLLAAIAFVPRLEVRADSGSAWLHVRVEEAKKASKVSINLPMTVVEAALSASPELLERHGKVKLGAHHGMKLADLRAVWKQLAAAGDAEFVTVESEDENVRVQRRGDTVQVWVDGKRGRSGKRAERGPGEVRVEVPVALVDALLSGEGEQVNLQAAIAVLQKRRGDIVRVHDADNHVRVWVDEQNAQTAAR